MAKHSGAMVAAIPTTSDLQKLYLDDGEAVEDLHLTLCYLGNAEDYSEDAQEQLISLLKNYFAGQAIITSDAFSANVFNPNTQDKETALVLGVSGDGIKSLYNKTHAALEDYGTENIPEQHNPWVPHITIAYSDDISKLEELIKRLGKVTFDKVRVAFGNNVTDIPLGENIGREGMMGYQASYLMDATSLEFSEDDSSGWVHALPIGTFKHPIYGTLEITSERAKRLAESVVKNIRGIDLSINYNHTNDGPNAVAAGWVRKAEARSDGLWLFVEWLKDAAEAIKSKKWRYFSAEFTDEWEDPQGNKFSDVIVGGALTNRPFMKNLVPINLSETTYDTAFELVSVVTGKSLAELKGGESMELSETDLNKIIEGVTAKLGEKVAPPKPADTDQVKLSEIEELKQLAEENPIVKTLVATLENQGLSLVENQQKLRETQVARALAEFDKSELVLTPVARNLVHELLLSMPEELTDKFWKLMEHMRKSQSFLVDLSEKAGVPVRYGVDRSPSKRFNEFVNKELANGVAYADAVMNVAAKNPELYEEYRQESFAFKTN